MSPPRTKHSQTVHVTEEDGIRYLHLGDDAIQSSMVIGAPRYLDLEYTRCMMSFLLFVPQPKDILMIGLGGGSLAKYVYRELPHARSTVVEIDADVVRIARSHFSLPPDDQRLRVRVTDGAQYVEGRRPCADIVLLDGFEGGRQAPPLTTPTFYRNVFGVLRQGGILVGNFMGDDPKLPLYLKRLGTVFGDRLACLRARGEGNILVLAFRDDPGMITRAELAARAAPLERQYRLGLRRYAQSLRRPANILKIAR